MLLTDYLHLVLAVVVVVLVQEVVKAISTVAAVVVATVAVMEEIVYMTPVVAVVDTVAVVVMAGLAAAAVVDFSQEAAMVPTILVIPGWMENSAEPVAAAVVANSIAAEAATASLLFSTKRREADNGNLQNF